MLTIEVSPRDQVSQGSRKNSHPNPFPHPHMHLSASLRPLVESAPAASLSSVSQLASSSNPLLAAHDWRQSEHLLIDLRSESRRSSAPEQAVANERVPKLCAHGDAPNEGTTGFEPPCALMWPLEVGVLQGGWVQQQQQQQKEHASGGSSSSSSSSRRARDPQLRVRHGRRAAGCMCARVGRSGPLPCPAAPAHAVCQPGQAAQSCARSGMVEPAGSTGRSACVQPCSVRGARSGERRDECMLLHWKWRSG